MIVRHMKAVQIALGEKPVIRLEERKNRDGQMVEVEVKETALNLSAAVRHLVELQKERDRPLNPAYQRGPCAGYAQI